MRPRPARRAPARGPPSRGADSRPRLRPTSTCAEPALPGCRPPTAPQLSHSFPGLVPPRRTELSSEPVAGRGKRAAPSVAKDASGTPRTPGTERHPQHCACAGVLPRLARRAAAPARALWDLPSRHRFSLGSGWRAGRLVGDGVPAGGRRRARPLILAAPLDLCFLPSALAKRPVSRPKGRGLGSRLKAAGRLPAADPARLRGAWAAPPSWGRCPRRLPPRRSPSCPRPARAPLGLGRVQGHRALLGWLWAETRRPGRQRGRSRGRREGGVGAPWTPGPRVGAARAVPPGTRGRGAEGAGEPPAPLVGRAALPADLEEPVRTVGSGTNSYHRVECRRYRDS